MKKILCKLFSVILTLTVTSQFFMIQNTRAIKVSQVINDLVSIPATDCINSMVFLKNYLNQKSVPNFDSDQLWDEIEMKSRALSLIFYMIIFFNFYRTSKDKTFTSLYQPKISLRDYIKRLLFYTSQGKESPCSRASIITTLMSLDELNHKNTNTLFVEFSNVHRLFATSYALSIKFCEDTFYDNIFMSKLCGIHVKEFNILEKIFVSKIDFQLFFKAEQSILYESLFESILKKIPYIEWDYDIKYSDSQNHTTVTNF